MEKVEYLLIIIAMEEIIEIRLIIHQYHPFL